jgi:hypothetical protein
MLPNNNCSGTTTTHSATINHFNTKLLLNFYKICFVCKSYIMHRLLICPPDASSPALWRHVQWVYWAHKSTLNLDYLFYTHCAMYLTLARIKWVYFLVFALLSFSKIMYTQRLFMILNSSVDSVGTILVGSVGSRHLACAKEPVVSVSQLSLLHVGKITQCWRFLYFQNIFIPLVYSTIKAKGDVFVSCNLFWCHITIDWENALNCLFFENTDIEPRFVHAKNTGTEIKFLAQHSSRQPQYKQRIPTIPMDGRVLYVTKELATTRSRNRLLIRLSCRMTRNNNGFRCEFCSHCPIS